jgi:hypothetical protein
MRPNRNRQRYKKTEKGQSIVELAVSLFVLLILLAGIVDLGRVLIIQFVLRDAAEEGVVYGTSFPSNCTQILSRITSNIDSQFVKNFDASTIKIQIQSTSPANPAYSSAYPTCSSSYSGITVQGGQRLWVAIPYTFRVTMPFLGSIVGQTIPMQVTASGIILRP